LGQGSLGADQDPQPELISAGGAHMLFTSPLHLEEQAWGPLTIYDRAAGGPTRVVSLLPGDAAPSGNVDYRGSSPDGRGVAFTVDTGITTLYLRHDNQTTYKIGDGLTFEGVAEGGARIFYLKGGSLFAFDAGSGKAIQFGSGGDITVVNVSADGSTAYFVSPDKLTSNPNPLNVKASLGKENLYQSREGSIRFIGTVSEADVIGEGSNVRHNGLGLWVKAVGREGGSNPGAFAIDPSRSAADGSVLLFQSDVDLTAYPSKGVRQVYRYDPAAGALTCLSCNPTGAAPTGDATLQDVSDSGANPEPNGPYDFVWNLSGDGRRAFFQSSDPLVAADTDGLQDVYEWEVPGAGSCTDPGGCLRLISSGRSEKVNYLYAASASGDDVFFRSSDLLVPADKEAVPSIYDARVDGGFPEQPGAAPCEGEGCHPQLTTPPILPGPGISPGRSGNVRKCPKGKHKVKRHGKLRCVKKKHHRHRRASATGKKGAGK
ncbi:MAG: hypothetical protein ACJ8F7_11770, partial [Gemmataceae bacterium]